MPREDSIRLRHMLDAAEDAVGFAAGKNRADLDSDRQLVMAVLKCVEIIGEGFGGNSGRDRSSAMA